MWGEKCSIYFSEFSILKAQGKKRLIMISFDFLVVFGRGLFYCFFFKGSETLFEIVNINI